MQTLSPIDAEKAFAVLEANGHGVPTVLRAHCEMGLTTPFASSQLEFYDTRELPAEVILERLKAAFAVGALASLEHDGAAEGLRSRQTWALSPSLDRVSVTAHHDGKTTFGRSWERARLITARQLRQMNAVIIVLHPLIDGDERLPWVPMEQVFDVTQAEHIALAKIIVRETGLEFLEHIERRFGITDMNAGAEIDRLAEARQVELDRTMAAA